MQSIDSNQLTIARRYRRLLTVWSALFVSFGLWIVFIRVFQPAPAVVNQRLGLLLICVSLLPTSLSFLTKQIMVTSAIQRQEIYKVHYAYVLAWTLCEASALWGLLNGYITGPDYYYYSFVIGGLGMILHFPQKKHLLAASGREF